ncbi:MAG TPA: ATP-binding protein, partial [Pilimelia sp.]|nr:ATP-binding protein [Pilimelia sp.]
MLLGRLRIRGRLALLVAVPLLAVAVLAVPVVGERVAAANRAADTADTVRIAGRVGALAQALQHERLLAVGHAVRAVARTRVSQQVTAVSTQVSRVRTETDLPAPVAAALAAVQGLARLREGALTGSVPPDRLISGYGVVIAQLIDSLRLESGVDVARPEGRQVVALDATLRMDEGISAGACHLLVFVATKDQRALIPYLGNLASLQVLTGRFTTFSTPGQLALYGDVQAELERRFGKDFAGTPNTDPTAAVATFTAATVFPALESLVSSGRVVADRIIRDVTTQVTDRQDGALITAYLVGGLVLLLILAVALLSVAVARAVVRPLTRLTVSADRVARLTQEELVRVADDEAEAPATVRLDPVDVGARDEIGDLARAFERVQGTAAGLVERQVASRRNVAQMFGHVGRRTQNLVARQIALIDRLEVEETDPGRLQHLYRLDHVSSRLRRNAGSLVVLSGATGDNEHLNPLALADVVRLGLGEIEDYPKVDVDVPGDLAVFPSAINDLVLVLAELMENATVFSPPHTRVTVSGQVTPYGARVSVVDHGIGMTEEQLARENARLQRRERLDLAPTGVLGLFVVGRLARRHGLGVLLSPTPGGGLTATIDLPEDVLATAWPAGPLALMAAAAPAEAAQQAAAPSGRNA